MGESHTSSPAILLRVFKQESCLEMWRSRDGTYQLDGAFGVLAWSGNLGPKLAEGDRQAPEGFYDTSLDRLRPGSRYHLGFDLGFPNAYDRARNRTGSFLMIHGGRSSTGCYAIGDEAIEVVYGEVADVLTAGGAVHVHCYPFRLTSTALADHARHRWYPFWRDELAPVFRSFERHRRPPIVDGSGGTYRLATS